MNRLKKILDQNGVSLVEVAVGLGIGVVAAMAVIGSVQVAKQMNQSAQVVSGRDTVVNNVRRYAGNPHALYLATSYSGNGALQNCVSNCGSCVANTETGFTLVDVENGPGVTPKPVAGSSPTPAVFDMTGNPTPCNGPAGVPSPSVNCPLLAITSFKPICPGGICSGTGATCNVTLEVNYAVWQYNPQGGNYAPVTGTSLAPVIGPPVPVAVKDINSTM